MQTYLNKSNKIILDTRYERKSNQAGFAILSLSSKKFYPKPFLVWAYKTTPKLYKQQENIWASYTIGNYTSQGVWQNLFGNF